MFTSELPNFVNRRFQYYFKQNDVLQQWISSEDLMKIILKHKQRKQQNWHQHMQTLGYCLGKLKNFPLFCFFFVLSFNKECPGKFQ